MDYQEYRQLRLFARYDGFYTSVILIASFVSYLAQSLFPVGSVGGQLAIMLCFAFLVGAPFFLYRCLKRFSKAIPQGQFTPGRAFLYCVRATVHAAFFFSLMQYLYLEFIDKGLLFRIIANALLQDKDEAEAVLRPMGLTTNEYISMLNQIDPLSLVSSSFVMLLIGAIVLSIIISLIFTFNNQRPQKVQKIEKK